MYIYLTRLFCCDLCYCLIQSVAIAVKSARCRRKLRYIPKFTAASCGPPCDSTASCYIIELFCCVVLISILFSQIAYAACVSGCWSSAPVPRCPQTPSFAPRLATSWLHLCRIPCLNHVNRPISSSNMAHSDVRGFHSVQLIQWL